jgi:GntR family transcriptional regulator
VPLYRQVAELLREGITGGLYPPGAQLPTEPALITHFDVTRPTVRAAFAELQAQGLVLTSRGRGTFVREAAVIVRVGGPHRKTGRYQGRTATSVEMEKAGRELGVRYLAVDKVPTNHDIAQRLEVRAGAPVARRRRLMMADGIPLQIATSYVPWDIAKNTAIASSECEPEGSYPHLEQAGHPIDWLEEEISARMPTPEEKSLLRLPPGTPVIRLIRTARDREGRPLEVADTINAADRYVLKYPYPYEPTDLDAPSSYAPS